MSGEEENEVEPMLKYNLISLGLLGEERGAGACCCSVHPKCLLLGTTDGRVLVSDFQGTIIKQIKVSSLPVNDVTISETLYAGIATDDGKIRIIDIFGFGKKDEQYDYDKQVYTIALHPRFGEENQDFIFGGRDGKLIQRGKSLFNRNSELVVDEGEILNCKWNGRYLAWANSTGVRIYDFKKKSPTAKVALFPPQQAQLTKMYPISLCWRNKTDLFIGCGNRILIYRISEVPDENNRLAKIVHLIDGLDYIVCGVAPFMHHMAVLCCYEPDTPQSPSEPAELRVFRLDTLPQGKVPLEDTLRAEITCDQLEIAGQERWRWKDYKLVCLPGDAKLFVMTPQCVVEVQHVEVDDHINWLVARNRFAEALRDAQTADPRELHTITVEHIVAMYLGSLMRESDWGGAIHLANTHLSTNPQMFQALVMALVHVERLEELGDIPLDNPRLEPRIYELVLAYHLPRSPHIFSRELQRMTANVHYDPAVLLQQIQEIASMREEILNLTSGSTQSTVDEQISTLRNLASNRFIRQQVLDRCLADAGIRLRNRKTMQKERYILLTAMFQERLRVIQQLPQKQIKSVEKEQGDVSKVLPDNSQGKQAVFGDLTDREYQFVRDCLAQGAFGGLPDNLSDKYLAGYSRYSLDCTGSVEDQDVDDVDEENEENEERGDQNGVFGMSFDADFILGDTSDAGQLINGDQNRNQDINAALNERKAQAQRRAKIRARARRLEMNDQDQNEQLDTTTLDADIQTLLEVEVQNKEHRAAQAIASLLHKAMSEARKAIQATEQMNQFFSHLLALFVRQPETPEEAEAERIAIMEENEHNLINAKYESIQNQSLIKPTAVRPFNESGSPASPIVSNSPNADIQPSIHQQPQDTIETSVVALSKSYDAFRTSPWMLRALLAGLQQPLMSFIAQLSPSRILLHEYIGQHSESLLIRIDVALRLQRDERRRFVYQMLQQEEQRRKEYQVEKTDVADLHQRIQPQDKNETSNQQNVKNECNKVFDFMQQHWEETRILLLPNIKRFYSLSPKRTLDLLVDTSLNAPLVQTNIQQTTSTQLRIQGSCTVDDVCTSLQTIGDDLFLLKYLHRIFRTDSSRCKRWYDDMIRLYADHMPNELLPFLQQATGYNLPRALRLCEDYGFYPGMIYILQQMGSSIRALEVMVLGMRDIAGAVRLYEEHNRDQQLLTRIVELCTDPKYLQRMSRHDNVPQTLASEMLSELAGSVNPHQLLRLIPQGRVIPGLKSSLIELLNKARLHKSVLHAAEQAARKDNVVLMERLVSIRRRGVFIEPEARCAICDEVITRNASDGGRIITPSTAPQPPFTPFGKYELQLNENIITFLCGHPAHESCVFRAQEERKLNGLDDDIQSLTQAPQPLISTDKGVEMFCFKCRR